MPDPLTPESLERLRTHWLLVKEDGCGRYPIFWQDCAADGLVLLAELDTERSAKRAVEQERDEAVKYRDAAARVSLTNRADYHRLKVRAEVVEQALSRLKEQIQGLKRYRTNVECLMLQTNASEPPAFTYYGGPSTGEWVRVEDLNVVLTDADPPQEPQP